MGRHRLVVIAVTCGLLGLLACGSSPPTRAPGNLPGAPGESLSAALERDIGAGRSVAIVAGQAGVRAISSDGARERTLAPDPAAWAIVDHRSRVVWFGNDDTTELRALDLDAPAAAPIDVHLVVDGLPPGDDVAMVGPPRYEIVYPSDEPGISPGEAAATGETFATASMDARRASLALLVQPSPELAADSGYAEDDDWERAATAATIRDRPFLATLLTRTDHRPPSPPRPAETHVDVDRSSCEDEDSCGRAQPIAGTPYWRVLVADMTGDVRHVTWQLYDPASRRLLDADWATWLADAWVAPDSSAFLTNGTIIRFDTGPLAATPPDVAGLGGSWLTGGTFYARFY